MWDTPLLVLGGGALVLLLIAGGGIAWSLLRVTGEQAFEAADTDYKNGSYTQAIAKLDEYLVKHPGHAYNSRARVMRGLAAMRRTVEGSKNFTTALATAKTSLSEIENEDAFVDARAELAGLLPDIADGLSKQATASPDAKLIEQAEEALSLVNQHVPAAMRNAQRLSQITADLDVTRRTLARDIRLRETVAKVNEIADKLANLPAAEAPMQLAAAYDARKQLLKDYPKLSEDPALTASIKKVSESERAAVTVFTETKDAVTEEAPSTVRASLALAARPQIGSANSSAMFVVAAPGAVLGLNTGTGEPLWRRTVGRDAALPPLPLAGSAEGDVLIADTDRQEVLRIEAATGKLRWRLPLGEAFYALPAVFGGELLQPLASGKLARIDLASGRLLGGWQLPHELEVAPAVDVRRKLIYQVSAHSNLYVLSPDEPVCREVFYLGHEAGSILAPPTLVSRYVMVAENTGLKDSVLRVVQTDENGLQLTAVHSEPLGGHVDSAPVVDGRMLHVVTDRGGLYALEIGVPDKAKPLSRLAERAGGLANPQTHYPIVKDSRFWVAGTELSRFSVQATGGKLTPDGVRLEKSTFLQPPQLSGNLVALLRRPPSDYGESALAVELSGRANLWETTFAAPFVGGVSLDADGQTAVALDALGNLYRVAPAELGRGGIGLSAAAVRDWPSDLARGDFATPPLRLESGALLWSLSGEADRLLALGADGASRWIALPEEATSTPRPFAGGVAIAGAEGRIYVINPAEEKNILEPFQPRVAANDATRRFGPAVVDAEHLLTADATGKVTLLAVKNEPKPHLEIEREATLDEALGGEPVVLGRFAYAVRNDGTLAAIELPTLEFFKSHPLGGDPVWGPERIGDRVLVVNADNELCCFTDAGEEAWRLPLAHGPLAGPPLVRGENLILLSRDGVVVRVSADGAEQAHAETGLEFFGGGAIVGQHVIASGANGTLYLVTLP